MNLLIAHQSTGDRIRCDWRSGSPKPKKKRLAEASRQDFAGENLAGRWDVIGVSALDSARGPTSDDGDDRRNAPAPKHNISVRPNIRVRGRSTAGRRPQYSLKRHSRPRSCQQLL